MNEGDFFTLIKAVLDAGLTARNITGVRVQQGAQPRQQGAPDGLFILLWKINWHPFGYPKVEDFWRPTTPPTNPPTGAMVHRETQLFEARIQVTGQAKQPAPPANLLALTAGDLCKIAGRILQSSAGLEQLRAGGLGTERLMQIPQAYFKDDSDQFAQAPNFDLTFTFTDIDEVVGRTIAEFDLKVYPV